MHLQTSFAKYFLIRPQWVKHMIHLHSYSNNGITLLSKFHPQVDSMCMQKKKHGWPRGRLQFEQYFKYPITYIICTETQNVTIWNFLHWLPWKLSFWQLPVQPAMKISSKWQHPRFSVHTYLGTSGEMLYGGRERSCVDPWLSSGSHEDSPRGFAEFAHLGDVVEFSSGGFRLENVCSIGLLVEFRLAASWSWWAPFNDGGSLFGEALAG